MQPVTTIAKPFGATAGDYADYVVILDDGRKLHVNTQYETIHAHEHLTDDCPAYTTMGGVCGCIPDVDQESVIQQCRDWVEPKAATEVEPQEPVNPTPYRSNPYMTNDPTQPCTICDSYCYGDCATS